MAWCEQVCEERYGLRLRELIEGGRSDVRGGVARRHGDRGTAARRLGATILAQLVGDARSLGYDRVRLETAKFMTAAYRTYEAAGFVDREPSTTPLILRDALGAQNDVVCEVAGEKFRLLGAGGSTCFGGGLTGGNDRFPPARGDLPATS